MNVSRQPRPRSHALYCVTSLCMLLLATPGIASAAQPPIGAGPTAGPGGPTQAGKDEKDGPAEAAPKDDAALSPVQEVPARPARIRRLQFFEAHGYMRMRADYFHRLDMGLYPNNPAANDLNNKFFPPPGETAEPDGNGSLTGNQASCLTQLNAIGVSAQNIQKRCARRNGFGSANMRLRIRPTLHVTDTVKVHATIDALDNMVLGSTPDSVAWSNPWAPIDLYTRTQTPPSAGINSFSDSLTVKEAYGHIRFGWGLDVKFGRMFNHWGMGLLYNDGNGYDRLEGADIVRQLDQDFGDSIDTVKLAYEVGRDPRTSHVLSVSYDWAASGPTTAQLLGPAWSSGGVVGQDFSAEKFDNVYQFSLSALRRDNPNMLRRKLSLDIPVVNYGLATWFRFQTLDGAMGAPGVGDGLAPGQPVPPEYYDGLGSLGSPISNGLVDEDGNTGLARYANSLVHRRAFVASPDLWLRVNWRTMRIELEAAGNFGYFYGRDLSDDPSSVNYDLAVASERNTIANGGYALEFKYGLFDDKFHLGLDQGFASGDNSGSAGGNPEIPFVQEQFTLGRGSNNSFRFNPAYMQDLLLFREMLGTAANAAYFKAWLAYYFFQKNFSARADLQYALAHQRAATPGNNLNYGFEIDAAVRYHDTREPIFVQLQYGVLFPFGAFNRPPSQYDVAGDGDARAVQTVQAQIGIKF